MASDHAFEKPYLGAEQNRTENTPEELSRIIRVVCGAEACRDAKDAKYLLEVMGINVRTVPLVGI